MKKNSSNIPASFPFEDSSLDDRYIDETIGIRYPISSSSSTKETIVPYHRKMLDRYNKNVFVKKYIIV